MPPSGKISVAEEGNKRVGSMTAHESRQCAKDVVAWFRSHGAIDDKEGTSPEALERFCKGTMSLPCALEELYVQCKEGVWFEAKHLVPLEAATKALQDIRGRDLFPFATDGTDYLVVNCDTEAVHEYEDDALGDKIADSFADFIEKYATNLLAGQFEYIEGCGVVEKTGAAKPRSGK